MTLPYNLTEVTLGIRNESKIGPASIRMYNISRECW